MAWSLNNSGDIMFMNSVGGSGATAFDDAIFLWSSGVLALVTTDQVMVGTDLITSIESNDASLSDNGSIVFEARGQWIVGVTGDSSVVRGGIGAHYIELLPGVAGGDQFQRGDCNNDGARNIADPIRLLNFLFPPTPPSVPLDCTKACDANDDASLNIADSVRMLNVLFPTGPPINWPAPDACGVDPTMDALDCSGYLHCP